MPVQRISMVQFRNYQEMGCELAPKMNILYGENGSGKTSILEAIHCLAVTKSFKTPFDKYLVKHGEAYYQLRGIFTGNNTEDTVQLNYVKNQGKKLFINGNEADRLSVIVGRHPVVTLTPEDGDITFGAPSVRRKYFNKIMSQTSNKRMELLQEFHQVLQQRNSVIQAIADGSGGVDETLLSVYDDRFIEVATEVEKARGEFIREYSELVEEIYPQLSGSPHKLTIEFDPSVAYESADQFREQCQELFEKRRNQELAFRRSVVGPQSDSIDFSLGDTDLRHYGSQGEHKLVLVVLKLAEGRYIAAGNPHTPIYLFDDLFAELDIKRSGQILDFLGDRSQIFITSTDLGDVRHHGVQIQQPDVKVLQMDELRESTDVI